MKQPEIEHILKRIALDPRRLSQPNRDQARPQPMLGRLTRPMIGRQ
jgi:hypothetical protein